MPGKRNSKFLAPGISCAVKKSILAQALLSFFIEQISLKE